MPLPTTFPPGPNAGALGRLAVISASPLLLIPLAWDAWSPSGSGAWAWFMWLFPLAWLALPLAVIVGVIGLGQMLVSGGHLGRSALVGGLACFAALSIALFASNSFREQAMVRAASNGKPIVAAIRAYEARYGKPPTALASLVPEFLAAVPSTGIGVVPQYRYGSELQAEPYGGNPWMLSVHLSDGSFSYHRLVYLPRENYQEALKWSLVRLLEGWAVYFVVD